MVGDQSQLNLVNMSVCNLHLFIVVKQISCYLKDFFSVYYKVICVFKLTGIFLHFCALFDASMLLHALWVLLIQCVYKDVLLKYAVLRSIIIIVLLLISSTQMYSTVDFLSAVFNTVVVLVSVGLRCTLLSQQHTVNVHAVVI